MTLENFYQSKAWQKCRRHIIADALATEGALYCARCGKEILEPNDAIVHHKTELNEVTINDTDVAFSPDNLEIVCHQCHNAIHDKGVAISSEKHVYILHGGTNSQREHYIYNHATDGALILSVPRLQKALSPRQPRGRVFSVVWQARDLVLAAIEKRFGQWTEAWVVGEFINMGEREALARRLGAACIDIAEAKAEAEPETKTEEGE